MKIMIMTSVLIKKPPNGELTNLVLVCAKKVRKVTDVAKKKPTYAKPMGFPSPNPSNDESQALTTDSMGFI